MQPQYIGLAPAFQSPSLLDTGNLNRVTAIEYDYNNAVSLLRAFCKAQRQFGENTYFTSYTPSADEVKRIEAINILMMFLGELTCTSMQLIHQGNTVAIFKCVQTDTRDDNVLVANVDNLISLYSRISR